MRPGTPRYPVDRYLVESSKKIEMVNIIDEEIWNPEPALRPEDEILLRKLHDMLQSTADDLKLLSGELSKFHEPGVQVKTLPTPLDDEFNEKVHIEEVVNAKFHGYKVIDQSSSYLPAEKTKEILKTVANKVQKTKINAAVQVNSVPIAKKPVINRNLGITPTKVLEIDEKNQNNTKGMALNNGKVINTMPAVAYNEFSYKYVEPKKISVTPRKNLHVQEMPSINIRSQLTEQKVLQLNIVPDVKDSKQKFESNSNVAVIAMEHETAHTAEQERRISEPPKIQEQSATRINKQSIRRVTKMSTCESSGSTNNVSSDTQQRLKTQKQIKTVIKLSPKTSASIDRNRQRMGNDKKESNKRAHLNLDEWKKKLNTVYGRPSTSRNRVSFKSSLKKETPKKSNLPVYNFNKPTPNAMNNADYIPYSQLTLGGVRVSDIEKEISDIPNKDVPLSPILDKILSSRENSFQNNSPRKILTTSDENLLQEVIDIERTVKKTISKNLKKKLGERQEKVLNISSDSNEANDSYADDFEDEKSEHTDDKNKDSTGSPSERSSSKNCNENINEESDNDNNSESNLNVSQTDIQNRTYTKVPTLSFKNSVDIFEFVHSVDTNDTATQSNTTSKISLKETQTSPPPAETSNIQPIHNDLWPSIDPRGEVENMFKLEKDFIKKLILEEYGDLLEKNITKPSTSKERRDSGDRNVAAFQKNTQTSPAHVKSVMTSPTRTKTRTTSPFVSLTVDNQTSPIIVVTNEEELNVEIDNDDLGISVNLSSPRFSLRLPQSSRELLSNLEDCSFTPTKKDQKENKPKSKSVTKSTVSSSTSLDADNSSSEISSLGEVKLRLKRKMKKRILSIPESSSSSSVSSKSSSEIPSGGILPLKSEGEVSLGQVNRKKISKTNKSEGETSYGPLSFSK